MFNKNEIKIGEIHINIKNEIEIFVNSQPEDEINSFIELLNKEEISKAIQSQDFKMLRDNDFAMKSVLEILERESIDRINQKPEKSKVELYLLIPLFSSAWNQVMPILIEVIQNLPF